MKAPEIDKNLNKIKYIDNVIQVTSKTYIVIKQILDLVKNFKPVENEPNSHIIWVRAERGSVSDYSNSLKLGIYETNQELISNWKEDYPDNYNWYKISITENPELIVIGFNHVALMEIDTKIPISKDGIDLEELFNWIKSTILNITDINEYNNLIENEIYPRYKFGIIRRSDYNKINTWSKERYIEKLGNKDKERFLSIVKSQVRNPPLKEMTAGTYLEACGIGYTKLEEDCDNKTKNLSLIERYKAYSDYQDGELFNLELYSAEQFENWYNTKEYENHVWEVIKGASNTRLHLYVDHDDKGYTFRLDGMSYIRSIDAIKFYIALYDNGLPVELNNSKEILARIEETDYIGIVPDDIFPIYCERYFKTDIKRGKLIFDFMNTPSVNIDKLDKFITWHSVERLRFRDE